MGHCLAWHDLAGETINNPGLQKNDAKSREWYEWEECTEVWDDSRVPKQERTLEEWLPLRSAQSPRISGVRPILKAATSLDLSLKAAALCLLHLEGLHEGILMWYDRLHTQEVSNGCLITPEINIFPSAGAE